VAKFMYNAAGLNSLSPLVFGNSGLGGVLASGNNTERVFIGSPQRIQTQSGYPGMNKTFITQSGLAPRPVIWEGLIVATTEALLNNAEYIIERYLDDGGAYTLLDNKGRSGFDTILQFAERIGMREKFWFNSPTSEAQAQMWRLEFLVLSPVIASNRL